MSTAARYDEVIMLPRAVRFPVEMEPPDGFDATRTETWPVVSGRLEYVEGRLIYMPPAGDLQQDTVSDVVITLGAWVRANPQFVLATNEAGMILHGSTRAADAAIWRRRDVGAYQGGLRRVPPLLAVEVGGPDSSDSETSLCDKARWYLGAGVVAVWIVLPETREVLAITASATARYQIGDRIAEIEALPGLSPSVDELFFQLERD